MRKAIVLLALMTVFAPVLPAGETEGSGRSELPAGGFEELFNDDRIDNKATEKAIEKVEKEIAENREKFEKKIAELNNKLSSKRSEEEKEEIQRKIEELTEEFSLEEASLQFVRATLGLVPVWRPTRDTELHAVRGNCGDLLALQPMDDRREVIETLQMLPDSCYEFSSGTISVHITEATSYLSNSACFHGDGLPGQPAKSGTYTLLGPGIMVMRFCDVKKSMCRVAVFMEYMSKFYGLALIGPDKGQRDEILVDVCPQSGQKEFPTWGLWKLLPLDATDADTDRDRILTGMIGGSGGTPHHQFGLGGLPAYAGAMAHRDFKERNALVDAKILEFAEPVQNIWTEIDSHFLPLIAPAEREWIEIKKMEAAVQQLLNGDLSPDSASDIAALIKNVRERYSDNEASALRKAAEKLEKAREELFKGKNKKAKKALKGAVKELDNYKRSVAKEASPIAAPRQAVIDAFGQKEFKAAGNFLKNLVKKHPDESVRAELEPLVEEYSRAAKKLQDYLEKIKTRLANKQSEDAFAEPITVAAGGRLSIFKANEGGTLDFETMRVLLKAVVDNAFMPAGPDGTVGKDTAPIEEWDPMMISVDELLNKGFTTAVIGRQGRRSAIVKVKREDGTVLVLQEFAGTGGMVESEIPLENYAKNTSRWIMTNLPNVGMKVIPAEDGQFLETFNFLDGTDDTAITVSWFAFSTDQNVAARLENSEDTVELTLVYAPGVYQLRLAIVDALQKDPMKRVLTHTLYFRILPPDAAEESEETSDEAEESTEEPEEN